MKNLWVLLAACLVVVQMCQHSVRAHPHRSIEETEEDVDQDTDEDTSSDAETKVVPAHPEPDPELEPEGEPSNVREMTGHSHEGESNEERNAGRDPDPDTDSNEEEQRNTSTSDEDDSVEFPRTEALCPARPEEITLVEQECAKEYQQWKESKAKKEMTPTTTFTPQVMLVETVDMTSKPGQASTSDEPMSESMRMMSTEEPCTTTEEVASTTTTTTMEVTTMTTTDDDTMTTTETEMITTEATTARTMTTTEDHEKGMTRRKRMVVKRKRSCYPATCIMRKLKLLDNIGQLNSKQIHKFATNMTMHGASNLEQKADECVKEINDAMVDNSSDIGKKVGCVAYKVITCLNKGLTCPVIKVPQN